MEVERKMYDLAEDDYSKAISLDKNNTDYLLNRADIYIRNKKKTWQLPI